ncbi:hypothetical protein GM3708_2640 [Geminocystis sp. NIES-3708]|nr:hypothetical protein GM3708_2640 [Geminocystis sp. NIES-3708]
MASVSVRVWVKISISAPNKAATVKCILSAVISAITVTNTDAEMIVEIFSII